MIDQLVVLPRDYAKRIVNSKGRGGLIDIRQDASEGLYVVDGYTRSQTEGGRHGISSWVRDHYVGSIGSDQAAYWYRVDPAVHFFGKLGAIKSGSLPLDEFKAAVEGVWIGLHRKAPALAITYADFSEGEGEPQIDWQAWFLSEAEQIAQVIPLAVVDEDLPLLAPLVGHWPLRDLLGAHVVVVGAGSIGSAANDALASYGVGHLTLVDYDRLLSHNFARHRAHPRNLGRRKVNAERERLLERDPNLKITALALDVIYDADIMRPIFADADVVLVAADGIDPRRAANHLARRAGTPAVFACVLENGAYGEIIRSRPPAGCLVCARAELHEAEGMEPETTLDLGYGTGTRHLPMTAVGGDLAIVGQMAAKVAAATILESKGHRDQRLPGDQAVVALRPRANRAAPFDAQAALDVSWRAMSASRPDCPTCGER